MKIDKSQDNSGESAETELPSPDAPVDNMPAQVPAPAPEDAPMNDTSMPAPEMDAPVDGGEAEEPVPDEMGTDNMEDANGGDSEDITDMFNSLSPEDQEAARKYIQSMSDNKPSDEPAGMGEEPMAENFIFTKGQLNECFGASSEELNQVELPKEKKEKTKSKRVTPFTPIVR